LIHVIWSALQGKTVYFFNNVGNGGAPTSDTAIPMILGAGTDGMPLYVGSITAPTGTPPSAVTDVNGLATVTINSTVKGDEYVYAVVDYTGNPQDGDPAHPTQWYQLQWDVAHKIWTPIITGTPVYKVFAQANGGPIVDGTRYVNILQPWSGVYDLEKVLGEVRTDDTLTSGGVNPNRDTIAVSVFDTLGNALPDYKVTFQLVSQGTTTSGSEDTYHPYAHFEMPKYDMDSSDLAGLGDLNPNVDANPIWGIPAIVNNVKTDAFDDDYAWGYTLNGEVNGVETLANAAHVDLVLDESPGVLAADVADAGGKLDFTDIVNVKIYQPTTTGYTLWKDFEVTKVWDLPVATTITYTPARQMGVAGVDVVSTQALVKDQYGNPMSGVVVDFKTAAGTEGVGMPSEPPFSTTTNAQGIAIYNVHAVVGNWGLELATATVDTNTALTSTVKIDWALDLAKTTTTAYTTAGSQVWHIALGSFAPWDGLTLKVYLNPALASIGSGTYYNANNLNITTSNTFITNQAWYVNAAASTDTDGAPNWIYGVTP